MPFLKSGGVNTSLRVRLTFHRLFQAPELDRADASVTSIARLNFSLGMSRFLDGP